MTRFHDAVALGPRSKRLRRALTAMNGLGRLSIPFLAALAGCYARNSRESIRHNRLQGTWQLPDAR